MKTAVFLQVRLDSSRLPGKALKKIKGITVIEHAMLSLRRLNLDDYVLLTAEGDQSQLKPLADRCGFTIFAGDRQDVLKRFIDAGRIYTPEVIIRATGDNPLVAFEPVIQLLQYMKENRFCDYTAMKGLPIGCGVEVFKRTALEKSFKESDKPYDHEHVTPYIYNNPALFSLYYHQHLPDMQQRVTMDTIDDFNQISSIFDDLYRNKPISFNTLKEYLLHND